jgi:alpha-1,3-glucan synthase
VQPSAWNGIYAYSRAWGAVSNWALVAFNTWSGAVEAGGAAGSFWTGWGTTNRIVNVMNTNETYTLLANGQLSNLWVNGYETKVFVRAETLKALDPMVTNCAPVHDARVTGTTQAITLKFSEPMLTNSLTNAVYFNGTLVVRTSYTYNVTNRTLTFTKTGVADGIHTIEVRTNAMSTVSNRLYSMFRSRFRKGVDLNPVANPQETWKFQTALINNGAASTTSNTVKLAHNAAGSTRYRASNNYGTNWSSWAAYATQTTWTIAGNTGVNHVVVQYWADGSAAYYAEDTITRN